MDEEKQNQFQSQEKNENIQEQTQKFKATVEIPSRKSLGDSAEDLLQK